MLVVVHYQERLTIFEKRREPVLDGASGNLAHAEYSLDAGPWQFIEPVGGLSDAKTEHYDFTLPANTLKGPAEHLLTVRVYDRYDNAGVAKTVFTAASEAR